MTPIRTTYYQPSTKEIPRTGVITTSGVGVVDAMPTSFTAHVEWRNDSHEIFDKMLAEALVSRNPAVGRLCGELTE